MRNTITPLTLVHLKILITSYLFKSGPSVVINTPDTLHFQGAEDLNNLWQSSGLTWEQFLPDDENVVEFVRYKVRIYSFIQCSHCAAAHRDATI